jgi:hypothetical protein
MHWRWIAAGGMLALLVLGCAQATTAQIEENYVQEEQPTEEPELVQIDPSDERLTRFTVDPSRMPVEIPSPMHAVPPEQFMVDPALQPLIELAQNDLATQFNIAPADTEVLEARAVTWPDRGLGCPRPGMVYIQVQVDGALIRLRHGDKVYQYHSGAGRPPVLCDTPQKIVDPMQPPPGGGST